MALYDQHLHSRHSFDSHADPEANVRAAMARGLAGLTFTEHFDTHPSEWEACVYDDESYSATIEALRSRFGGELFIGKGIEVCYQPSRMDFIVDHLDRHRFDVVLLSVHYFGDRPVHVRDAWDGMSVVEGTRKYFAYMLEAVRFCERLHRERGPVFDVLAHLDFVKRYTKRFFGEVVVGECMDLIEEILTGCLAAGLVPEINTSTLRQGHEEPMPPSDVIRLYARLGGTAMSLGSDAHRSEDIGSGFDRAVALLAEAGIGRTVVFKDRERVEVPVES
jgi:histidinol-phosphatase (PHP family)